MPPLYAWMYSTIYDQLMTIHLLVAVGVETGLLNSLDTVQQVYSIHVQQVLRAVPFLRDLP